jgi:hypothetical protein
MGQPCEFQVLLLVLLAMVLAMVMVQKQQRSCSLWTRAGGQWRGLGWLCGTLSIRWRGASRGAPLPGDSYGADVSGVLTLNPGGDAGLHWSSSRACCTRASLLLACHRQRHRHNQRSVLVRVVLLLLLLLDWQQ